MGGGKGGSSKTTTKVELPKYVEDAAKSNLAIADEVAAIGYTPYSGPTVAGFTPMQRAAMGNTNAAASAFGMESGNDLMNRGVAGQARGEQVDPLTGMTQKPTSYAGGIMGYSPMATYNQAVNNIPTAQRQFINSFTIDPRTGSQPANPAVPETQFRPQVGSTTGGKGRSSRAGQEGLLAQREAQSAVSQQAMKKAAEAAALEKRRAQARQRRLDNER